MGFIEKIALSIVTSFGKKGLESFFKDSRSNFTKEIQRIINETINQFKKTSPIEEKGGKIAFYSSQLIVEELLKFRLFGNFDQESIISKIQNDSQILPANTAELSLFFQIFTSEVKRSSYLMDFEMKELYHEKVFEISEKLKETNSLLESVITDLKKDFAKLPVMFKSELDEVEKQIFQFMPKSALERIRGMEKRMAEVSVEDSFIIGKLTYLKALCKSDMNFEKVEVAKEFIKAYRLSSTIQGIKDKACIEYLNVGESAKAISLANDILNIDEYNHTAWIVKVLTSPSLVESLEDAPKVVKDSKAFQISMAHNLISSNLIKSFAELNDIGISPDLTFKEDETFNYTTQRYWYLKLNLIIQQISEEFPTHNIFDKITVYERSFLKDDLTTALDKIYEGILSTESYEYRSHQIFYYHLIKYLKGPEESNLSKLLSTYGKVKKHPVYLIPFVQVLVKHAKPDTALDLINEFLEDSKHEISSEVLLIKTLILAVKKEYDGARLTYKGYIELQGEINTNNAVNIINLFGVCLMGFEGKKPNIDLYQSELDFVSERLVSSEKTLKSFVLTSIEARVSPEPDIDKLKADLASIKNHEIFESEYLGFFLAVSYHSLGLFRETLNVLNRFVKKDEISKYLRFYIDCLHDLLTSDLDAQGAGQELLSILEFWRLSSDPPDKQLLLLEYDLVSRTGNSNKMLSISSKLYQNFKEDEQIIMIYFHSLFMEKKLDKLSDESQKIPENYSEENTGLQISRILKESGVNDGMSFTILHNLANDAKNKRSRAIYVGMSRYYEEEFKHFDAIEDGVFVKYEIEKKVITKKFEDIPIKIRELIRGKQKNQSVFYKKELTQKIIKIRIIDIFNDKVKLIQEIFKEASDPTSGLGLEMIEIDTSSVESMSEEFQKISGYQGTVNKITREQALNEFYNYNKGFTEIALSIFNDDFVTAYFYLTSSPNSFMCIPSFFLKGVKTESENRFIIDFPTLLLFYELSEKFDVNFKEKFVISPIIENEIRRKIIEGELEQGERMSLDITMEYVRRHSYTIEQQKKDINVLRKIEKWIEQNCIVEYAEEKLDLVLKMEKPPQSLGFDLLIDISSLLQRDGYKFISNDTFPLKYLPNFRDNTINPEIFFEKFMNEGPNDNEISRFMLMRRYIGIKIPLPLLLSEFNDYLLGKENYYKRGLISLRHSINPNEQKFEIVSDFLKELYLKQTLSLENKNIYAREVLFHLYTGASKELIRLFNDFLQVKFRLMGRNMNEIMKVSNDVKKSMFG